MLGELRLIVGPQSGLRWMRLTSRACAHEKPCVLLRGRESLMMSTLKKKLNLFFFGPESVGGQEPLAVNRSSVLSSNLEG